MSDGLNPIGGCLRGGGRCRKAPTDCAQSSRALTGSSLPPQADGRGTRCETFGLTHPGLCAKGANPGG